MNMLCLIVGLLVGFVIGAVAGCKTTVTGLIDEWRAMLDKAAQRLDDDQTITVNFSISKFRTGDEGDDGCDCDGGCPDCEAMTPPSGEEWKWQ